MKITSLSEKINTIFNAKQLLASARATKLLRRARQTNPFQLVLAFIETLGCQSKANIADIHRKYQALSGMLIHNIPFHNQIKKETCTHFFKQLFEHALKIGITRSLKLTTLSSR